MRVKLKKVIKIKKVRQKGVILRRDEEIQHCYAVKVSSRYSILSANKEIEGVEKDWRVLQGALVGASKEIIPNEGRGGKKA